MAGFDVKFGRSRQVSSYYALAFPRVANVSQFIASCAGHLGERFGNPQVTGIPEQMDPMLPRVVFPSIHGFSVIVISASTIGLNINYSPDWQVEEDLRLPHLLDSIHVVSGLINILNIPRVLYSGLNCVYEIDVSADERDLKLFLADKFLSPHGGENLFDLQLKITRVLDQKFFINSTWENFRTWPQQNNAPQFSVPLSYKLAQTHGVRLSLDLNDRYAFNEARNYASDLREAGGLVRRSFAEATSALQGLQK